MIDYALKPFGETLVEALRPLCVWETTNLARVAAKRGAASISASG